MGRITQSDAGNRRAQVAQGGLWAATDPVEPLRDYSIPINPFRHPPQRENPQPDKRRRRRQEDSPRPEVPRDDGHIDDYA